MSTSTQPQNSERITVDLPEEDYAALKIAAATGGRGVNMSTIIRGLVHDFVQGAEDSADIAIVRQRMATAHPALSTEELMAELAQRGVNFS